MIFPEKAIPERNSAMTKTNVVRLLEAASIPFETMEYAVTEDDLSGVTVAKKTGLEPERVFKTLVAVGDKKGIAVFCIPCNTELDLKKAAIVSGNKKVEMLKLSELLPTTGYIRGGCSPVGMKKLYPTYIHESAQSLDKIYVSAGVRGAQVILSPTDLASFIGADFADLTRD